MAEVAGSQRMRVRGRGEVNNLHIDDGTNIEPLSDLEDPRLSSILNALIMSTLGSSVINKSGKKFAPRAPVRRAPVTTSTHASAKADKDGPRIASTPSSENVRQAAESATSVPGQTPEVNPTNLDASTEVSSEINEENTPLRISNAEKPIQEQSATQTQEKPTDSSAKLLEPQAESTRSTGEVAQSNENDLNAQPATNPRIHSREPDESAARSSPEPNASSDLNLRSGEPQEEAPSAKRRKTAGIPISKPSRIRTSSNIPVSTPAPVSAPPPISTPDPVPAPTPSVEVHHEEPVMSQRNQPVEPNEGSTNIENNTPATSQTNLHDEASHTSAVSAKKAGRPPQKKTSKQRAEAAAAKVVRDATRKSNRRGNDTQSSAKVTKSRRAKTTSNTQRLQDAAAEIVADAVEGNTAARKGRRGRKERQPTPEEAEDKVIDPDRIKMAELCKDIRQGKKSHTLKRLEERDKEELANRKQAELQQLVATGDPPDPTGQQDAENSVPPEGDTGRDAAAMERQEEVLQHVAETYFDPASGQIMIGSAQIDRHEEAAAERAIVQEGPVVEDDLTKRPVNSGSHMKREKMTTWDEDSTDDFYKALRMFGTDFGMISQLLRKTRRAVKLKFTREEKSDPGRIKTTLLGERIPVDLDDYSRRAGIEIKLMEEHEREMEEDRKRIEENAALEVAAKEEADQLRRDQDEQEKAAGRRDSTGKENRDPAQKKRKRQDKKNRDKGERNTGDAVAGAQETGESGAVAGAAGEKAKKRRAPKRKAAKETGSVDKTTTKKPRSKKLRTADGQ
ncbi:MAG: hypothetical protein Q9174_002942 [Haloplaca sp. 1 TL-2023]